MPKIYGEKIMLREFQKEDLEFMRKWVNDSDVTGILSDEFLYPQTLNNTEDYLNSVLEGKHEKSNFVIADKTTESYIGQINLFKVNWKNRVAEMGIVIGIKECQGKGFAHEAILLLQKFAFNTMNLNRVELTMHEYNQKAYNLYIKCGFKEEGRLRQKVYTNGKYADAIYMAILKSEYDAIQIL